MATTTHASLTRSDIHLPGHIWVVGPAGTVGNDFTATSSTSNTAIQDAINAASANGGGIVFIKAGIYILAAMVNLAANVSLCGEGYATKIIQAANYTFKIASISNVRMHDLLLDGNLMTAGNSFGIYLENASSVRIFHCDLINMSGFGIFTTSNGTNTASRIWITDNYVQGKGTSDVIGGGPANSTGAMVKDVFVSRNIVVQDATQGTGHSDAINFVAAGRVQFTRNQVEGGMLFGSEQQPHKHSTIQGNVIKKAAGATRAALGMVIGASANQTGDAISIANNTLDGGFIDLFSNPTTPRFTNVSLSGNVVNAAGVSTAGGEAGIRAVNLDGLNAHGNTVYSSTGDGVWLTNCLNANLNGNTIRDSSGYGVRETGTTDYTLLDSNIIRGNASGATSQIGTHNVTGTNSTS